MNKSTMSKLYNQGLVHLFTYFPGCYIQRYGIQNNHYSVDVDLSGVELIDRRIISTGSRNGNNRKSNSKVSVVGTAYMEYWRSRRWINDQGIYFGSSASQDVVLC